jgi:AcrR family transcriptional regulator
MEGEMRIYTHFLKLNAEKRERILNAAMKVFAEKGYKNTSTDEIVNEAGISKGALFHYFNSKKGLFIYLYNYVMDILLNEMIVKFNFEEKDFFARIKQGSMLKLEIMKKYPEMFNFTLAAYMEKSNEVKDELNNSYNELFAKSQAFLYEGVDFTGFKAGLEIKRVIEIVIWTMEGLSNRELAKIKNRPFKEENFIQMLDEADVYLKMLKDMFYTRPADTN